jgi:hypothetical protein
MTEELRILRRAWPVLLTPLAVLVLARLMVPANRAGYQLINQDPKGFDQLWDSYLSTGANLYTTGFLCGQLVAMLFGGLLVLADRGPANPVRESILVVAAFGGVLLGLTNVLAARTLAPDPVYEHWARKELVPNDPKMDLDVLHQPGVWHAIMAGLVAYPLWALIGVGLAARFRRAFRVIAGLLLGAAIGAGLIVWAVTGHHVPGWAELPLEWVNLLCYAILLPLWPSASNFYLVTETARDSGIWFGVGMDLLALAYAVALLAAGRRAARNRAATPTPVR